jgi:hypothetical protein
LYRAYHEEAKVLARTAQERSLADAFLDEIDIIELGQEAGRDRARERARQREARL